tara:strand:+ start:284 stop:664 length:381 start_codon:yes stop_codon:yes gene_type:complete
MNTELLIFSELFEKKLRSSTSTKTRKQKFKTDQKIACWILNRLRWKNRRIARLLCLSHHTVDKYISEAEELLSQKEITCEANSRKEVHSWGETDVELLHGDIQVNPSRAKRTIGVRHHYDGQEDYY